MFERFFPSQKNLRKRSVIWSGFYTLLHMCVPTCGVHTGIKSNHGTCIALNVLIQFSFLYSHPSPEFNEHEGITLRYGMLTCPGEGLLTACLLQNMHYMKGEGSSIQHWHYWSGTPAWQDSRWRTDASLACPLLPCLDSWVETLEFIQANCHGITVDRSLIVQHRSRFHSGHEGLWGITSTILNCFKPRSTFI
jgi:hypothetical protein